MAMQKLSDRDFQAFVKGSFRDVRRMFEISQGQAKALASSHLIIINKLAELTAAGGVFEEGGEPGPKQPKTIRDVYDRRMQSASVVFQGLFNGNLFGDVRGGQKRACILFRQVGSPPSPRRGPYLCPPSNFCLYPRSPARHTCTQRVVAVGR